MKISIITPSYGQLDWLRMCIASVADQNQSLKQGSWKMEDGSLGGNAHAAQKLGESRIPSLRHLLIMAYLKAGKFQLDLPPFRPLPTHSK